MGLDRQELTDYLNQILSLHLFQDYAPNGLQIEGRQCIQTLCTAVTASQMVIDQAIALKADALLVHHGYFWRGEQPAITGMKKSRIAALLRHDVNLLAYHLPLDAHLTLGNNAGLADALHIHNSQSIAAGGNPDLLWHGYLDAPMNAQALGKRLQAALGRQALVIEGHGRPISHLAWCTGGAQDYIELACQLGADAFVTGEVSERTFYCAKEMGITFYGAGHHATERFGVQRLGEHLQNHFSLSTHFIDSDNPV